MPKTLKPPRDDWYARIQARLASSQKAAKPPDPEKKCRRCARTFRRTEPTCWKDREGPYCYDCWEES